MTDATDRLTGDDRRAIAAARELAALTGPRAVREYTGDPEPLTAYAVAFERAGRHLGALLAIIARLAGDEPGNDDTGSTA